MKTVRLLCSFFALASLAVAALAADPSGTWKWITPSPNGDISTTLKLESKGGKLVGAYSNQFGDAMISNASFKDDVLAFEVVREFNGEKFVVKYHGKLEGDTIKGTLEAPGGEGEGPLKLDWNAKRAPTEKPADAKSKS